MNTQYRRTETQGPTQLAQSGTKPGAYTDPEIRGTIEQLSTGEKWNAVAIHRHLETDEAFAAKRKAGLIPALRTVQHIARSATVRDKSGAWTLADDDVRGEQAAMILPILASAIERRRGQALTRAEARWALKIRLAAPELSAEPVTCWRLAVMFHNRVEHDESTADLDGLLAFAPWRSGEALQAYVRANENGWVNKWPLAILAASGSGVGDWARTITEYVGYPVLALQLDKDSAEAR